jgi:hypothetical protein
VRRIKSDSSVSSGSGEGEGVLEGVLVDDADEVEEE